MPLTEVKLSYNSEASSLLQRLRKETQLPIPQVLTSTSVELQSHEALGAFADHAEIERAFPVTYGRPRVSLRAQDASAAAPASTPFSSTGIRVGVVLSGGQAPGGHNVIAGIFDYCKRISPLSEVIGFLDGPQGIYNGKYAVLDSALIDHYRNSGGFDMICSGRHKIEKAAEFEAALKNCTELRLDGLVIIGGDDSNTNAAVLAEYFEAHGSATRVCGCPKTIDGDLKVDPYIPISFGFDTACRTYSELVGNLTQDTLSSQKYYHFVRLMGRAASNIALECALLTRPNVCLISEEVQAQHKTLVEITHDIVAVIRERARRGKHYGVVLLPEGLIEFIPEFNALIEEINDVLDADTDHSAVRDKLSEKNRAVFDYLPLLIQEELLLDRDPHGNVQVAKIETERLLAQTVEKELQKLTEAGEFSGEFNPQFHSYGYEGRSCLPSVFDATYCYVLGQNVAALLSLKQNGLISSVTNLTAPVSEWQCGGVPITMMCRMERRHGHLKPVINKALVELNGEPFKCFAAQRADWAVYDLYRSPGPIQFFHPSQSVELCITLSLELLKSDPRMDPALLAASKAQQDVAHTYGPFVHSPITDVARDQYSTLQVERAAFQPQLCPAFSSSTDGGKAGAAVVRLGHATQSRRAGDRALLACTFPRTYGAQLVSVEAASPSGGEDAVAAKTRIGVVFCGRQAPGSHDVLSGILDALHSSTTASAAAAAESTLIGFVGGTDGLLHNHSVEITKELLALYRGQGGLDLLGRSADKLSASSHATVKAVCEGLELDGLVLVGGARTCTDAAYLSEYLASSGSRVAVVVVPVDISGSLKNEFVETTVGFDTATRVAAQVVANNATDGASAKKYYYFMRIMGDRPSHSTLEVALATKPDCVILAEEVRERHMSLSDIVHTIADVVQARAAVGKNYGTVVMPEGLVESIPELKNLISEIDAMYAAASAAASAAAATPSVESREPVRLHAEHVRAKLTMWSKAVLESLPDFMQASLLLSRGSNHSIQLSQAQTERMLAHFVEVELSYRKAQGKYKGSFAAICSFIGYQARGAAPSNFDVNYAYNIGHTAVVLIQRRLNGYLAVISHLKQPVSAWTPLAVPLVSLLESQGSQSLVGAGAVAVAASGNSSTSTSSSSSKGLAVPKALVDVRGAAYLELRRIQAGGAVQDRYENPGPLQFYGPTELVDSRPITLSLESYSYLQDFQELRRRLDTIEEACRPGCSTTVLNVAIQSLSALTSIIDSVRDREQK